MMKNHIINRILEKEGGYVNDPSDSGGETNHGITVQRARAYGYHGPMRDMPVSTARHIYELMYWHSVRGDTLVRLSPSVAAEVVDTAVNMGPARAVAFLQRALNVMNRKQRLYEDIEVDGLMGAMTIHALKKYLATRSDKVLCKALNCLQGAAYVRLAERRVKDERFVYGWIKERVKL